MTDSDGSASVLILKIDEIVLYCPYITVLASTTVDLYFLHNFHLDSSEVV